MNNFEEFGFEEYKNNNIIKIVLLEKVSEGECDDLDFLYREDKIVGYILGFDGVIPTYWELNGECYYDSCYNLTPIKKQWYKDKSNFPCLVVDINGYFEVATGAKEDNLIIDYEEFCVSAYKPATKEEALNLVIKEQI